MIKFSGCFWSDLVMMECISASNIYHWKCFVAGSGWSVAAGNFHQKRCHLYILLLSLHVIHHHTINVLAFHLFIIYQLTETQRLGRFDRCWWVSPQPDRVKEMISNDLSKYRGNNGINNEIGRPLFLQNESENYTDSLLKRKISLWFFEWRWHQNIIPVSSLAKSTSDRFYHWSHYYHSIYLDR